MGQEPQSSASAVSDPRSHLSSHGINFSMNIFSLQMKQPQSQDKTTPSWTLVKLAVGGLGPGPGLRNAYSLKNGLAHDKNK